MNKNSLNMLTLLHACLLDKDKTTLTSLLPVKNKPSHYKLGRSLPYEAILQFEGIVASSASDSKNKVKIR